MARTFGDIPTPPAANLGGTFTDIGEGLQSFLGNLRAVKQAQADEAFRAARLAMDKEQADAALAERAALRRQQMEEALRNRNLRRELQEDQQSFTEGLEEKSRLLRQELATEATNRTRDIEAEQTRARERAALLDNIKTNVLGNLRGGGDLMTFEERKAALGDAVGRLNISDAEIVQMINDAAGERRKQAEGLAGMAGLDLTGGMMQRPEDPKEAELFDRVMAAYNPDVSRALPGWTPPVEGEAAGGGEEIPPPDVLAVQAIEAVEQGMQSPSAVLQLAGALSPAHRAAVEEALKDEFEDLNRRITSVINRGSTFKSPEEQQQFLVDRRLQRQYRAALRGLQVPDEPMPDMPSFIP